MTEPASLGVIAAVAESTAFKIVEWVAAIVAVAWAWRHASHLKDVSKNLVAVDRELSHNFGEVSHHLEIVGQSLSTRYLGTFPEYVDKIVELIDSARKSIVIACDYPGYCIFSDHQRWLLYEAAVARAIDRHSETPASLSVSICWLGSKERAEVLREQFQPIDPFSKTDTWKTPPLVEKRLRHFLDIYGSYTDLATALRDITFNEFHTIVEREHDAIARRFQAIKPHELMKGPQIYFWIVDDTQCVFAIPNYKERDKGLGFYSRDMRIIDGLTSLHGRLH